MHVHGPCCWRFRRRFRRRRFRRRRLRRRRLRRRRRTWMRRPRWTPRPCWTWHNTGLSRRPAKAPDGRKKGNSPGVCPYIPPVASDACEHRPTRYARMAFQWWHVELHSLGLTRARVSCLYFFHKNGWTPAYQMAIEVRSLRCVHLGSLLLASLGFMLTGGLISWSCLFFLHRGLPFLFMAIISHALCVLVHKRAATS